MGNRLDPEERYWNDPTVHALVETLAKLISEGQTTVRELHAIVELAQTKYEVSQLRGGAYITLTDGENVWGAGPTREAAIANATAQSESLAARPGFLREQIELGEKTHRQDGLWFDVDNANNAYAEFKPSWKDAPQWANWLARDSDGRWYWYEDKPEIPQEVHNRWVANPNTRWEWQDVPVTVSWPDAWEKSIEARPTHGGAE